MCSTERRIQFLTESAAFGIGCICSWIWSDFHGRSDCITPTQPKISYDLQEGMVSPSLNYTSSHWDVRTNDQLSWSQHWTVQAWGLNRTWEKRRPPHQTWEKVMPILTVLEWFVDFLHSSDYRQQITWIGYNQKFEWNIDKSHSSDKSNTTRMIHTTNLTQNRLERTSKRKFTLWN